MTRPRVVMDPHFNGQGTGDSSYYWTVRDGALHFRWSFAAPDQWVKATGADENLLLTPTPERVALWADLLAHPTEEVDA